MSRVVANEGRLIQLSEGKRYIERELFDIPDKIKERRL